MPTPAAAETPRMRLDFVDGMRAFAALIVYVNHAYAQVSAGDSVQLQSPWRAARFSMVAGHLSVTVFIVISGFCLTLPVIAQGGQLRGGVKGFLKRRARRILPPYYAAVLLCMILIWTIIGKPTGSLWDYPLRVTPIAIVSHLLLLQDFIATSLINYVFWSIAVEWQIYFLVPLLVMSWQRFGAGLTVGGALALGFALRIGVDNERLNRAHPQFLGMFALGMAAAYVTRSNERRFVWLRDRIPWAALCACALLMVVGLSWRWGIGLSENRFHWLDMPVGIMTSSGLAAAASQRPNALGRVFSWPPLVVLGTFSYSLYLIHAPLLQVIWQYALVPLGVSREAMLFWLLTLGFALVALISYAFFRLFEAPFMRSPVISVAAKPNASHPFEPQP